MLVALSAIVLGASALVVACQVSRVSATENSKQDACAPTFRGPRFLDVPDLDAAHAAGPGPFVSGSAAAAGLLGLAPAARACGQIPCISNCAGCGRHDYAALADVASSGTTLDGDRSALACHVEGSAA